jgi:chromosome segregation ATPase
MKGVFLLEKMKFKSALFGFKRRQVLQYVNQTCLSYEGKLQEQTNAHNAYRAETETQLQELSRSLENSRLVCAGQEQALEQLEGEMAKKEASLEQAAAMVDGLCNKLQEQEGKFSALQEELAKKESVLSQKDKVIATQAVEVSRLQEQVSKLETEFEQLRGQTEQSTALVNCLNVLHDRNRKLISQIATLETRLEDATHGEQVEEYKQTARQNHQMISSTEQLFAALRKEIGDALETISSKIESGGISETDDGNYFVDMANL